MRRKEKEIRDPKAIDAVLFGCRLCHLAMAKGNEPYLVPVCYGYDGRHIYFHTAPAGRKIEFLKVNARVCFQMERDVQLITSDDGPCRWTFHFESVVGHGTAAEVADRSEKQYGLDQITAHYGGRTGLYPEGALSALSVWRITIDSITGKKSPAPAF